MTTAAPPISYTPADVERLSHQDGKLYELVQGELTEKRVSFISNLVATRVAVVLSTTYPITRAYVVVEQPTYCFDEARQEGRRPDVAMVWRIEFQDGPTHDELSVVPDLVIEIVSPSNTFMKQQARVNKFRRAGAGMVWLIDPDARAMHVYRGRSGAVTYLEGDALFENEELLPGLKFRLADIFPPAAAVHPA